MKIIVNQLKNIFLTNLPVAFPDTKREPRIFFLNSQNLSDAEFGKLQSHLDNSETEQALKFRFEKDRKEFIAARGALRILISNYLMWGRFPKIQKLGKSVALSPKEIQFKKGKYGKPKLANHPVSDGNRTQIFNNLNFNISHSNGMIAVGFGFDDSEIGIDIEKIKQPFDYQGIVQNYFTPKEQKFITSEDKFFELWTRKEALLKVTGIGLTNDLTKFDVSDSGVTSDFEDERFLPFSNKTYYIKSFKIREYWVSLATENDTQFELIEMGKIII